MELVNCEKAVEFDPANSFTGTTQEFVANGVEFVDNAHFTHVEEKTTYIIFRDGHVNNLWHQLADIMYAVAVLEILKVPAQEAQILILDPLDGAFLEVWQAISKYPLKRMTNLRGGPENRTMFKRAILWPTNIGSPIWRYGATPSPCKGSEIMESTTNRILHFYGLLNEPIPAKPTITIVNRSNRVGRVIANIDDLVKDLKHDPSIDVQVVDFATIPLREQIRIIRNTNILVGIHGAGLFHMMFLPKEAVVVELFLKTWRNTEYRNMAKYFGLTYLSWQNQKEEHHLVAADLPPTTHANMIVDKLEFHNMMDAAIRVTRQFGVTDEDIGFKVIAPPPVPSPIPVLEEKQKETLETREERTMTEQLESKNTDTAVHTANTGKAKPARDNASETTRTKDSTTQRVKESKAPESQI